MREYFKYLKKYLIFYLRAFQQFGVTSSFLFLFVFLLLLFSIYILFLIFTFILFSFLYFLFRIIFPISRYMIKQCWMLHSFRDVYLSANVLSDTSLNQSHCVFEITNRKIFFKLVNTAYRGLSLQPQSQT